MNSAAKSLHLCVLFGSCYLFASGDLSAHDQSATTVVSRSTEKAPSDSRRVVEDSRHSPYAVKVNKPQESLPTPVVSERVSALKPEPVAVPKPQPVTSHKPAITGSAPFLPGHAFTDEPELNIPPYGFPASSMPICDGTECDGLAAVGTNRPRQHPAPEAVLRFSRGCTDAEFSNWSLSSRDVPRASAAIPHGPLMIELRIGMEPVEFVELMFDGKPLKPSNEILGGPLSFSVPCPAPGQHWIQARYLSDNVWSYYSQPLRFEVRLLQKPRIIAASDFDRDPTPLVRNAVPSITSHSIKVYLADIDNGDKVVAYVDGKPLPSTGMPELSQSESGPCCHVFQVQGIVTPGVHKLTVRAVGCPDACSITSEPSDELLFHYYDEEIYLLRPGAGCNNKVHSSSHDPTNRQKHTSNNLFNGLKPDLSFTKLLPLQSSELRTELWERSSTAASEVTQVNTIPTTRFVSYIQDVPASSLEATEAYNATVIALNATPLNVGVQYQVDLIKQFINSASKETDEIERQYQDTVGIMNDATTALDNVRHRAAQARHEANVANSYANIAKAGDAALARVAQRRSELAQQHTELAFEQAALAEQNYKQAKEFSEKVLQSRNEAKKQFDATLEFRSLAESKVEQLSVARGEVEKAMAKALAAYNDEAVQRPINSSKASQALKELISAKQNAEKWSKSAIECVEQAKEYAIRAKKCSDAAGLETNFARKAVESVTHFKALVAGANLADHVNKATDNANDAGRVMNMSAATERARDEAEERGAYESLAAKFNAANGTSDENGVRRTQVEAASAEKRASDAWIRAESRIAAAEANVSFDRAQSVVGPPSPFFFASTAHFPIREFGLRGETLERDGILIYEDMEFSFDRHGNYVVKFRASTPKMPSTVRLQFQIQPHRGGPWYTVTLAPIEFPYPTNKNEPTSHLASCDGNGSEGCGNDENSKECCGKTHKCACKGHSEILLRCYAEMGKDAKIRRSGTARFGFGVDVP